MATNKRYWLGNPGGRLGMVQLPSIAAGAASGVGLAEQIHSLIGGGKASVRAPLPKRNWQLKRAWLKQAEQDIIRGHYLDLYGNAPYRFIDPSERNLLRPDASTFGGYTGDTSFWITSGGVTLTRNPTATNFPPLTDATRAIRASDAMNSSAISSVALLTINSNQADDTIRVPRIPGASYDFSVWVARLTGTSVYFRASLIGTSIVNGDAVQVIGSNWVRIRVNATDEQLGAPTPYVDMRINTVAPYVDTPTVCFRAPQLSMTDGTEDYSPGLGVANVIFASGDGLGQATPRTKYRDLSWTLAEI